MTRSKLLLLVGTALAAVAVVVIGVIVTVLVLRSHRRNQRPSLSEHALTAETITEWPRTEMAPCRSANG